MIFSFFIRISKYSKRAKSEISLPFISHIFCSSRFLILKRLQSKEFECFENNAFSFGTVKPLTKHFISLKFITLRYFRFLFISKSTYHQNAFLRNVRKNVSRKNVRYDIYISSTRACINIKKLPYKNAIFNLLYMDF